MKREILWKTVEGKILWRTAPPSYLKEWQTLPDTLTRKICVRCTPFAQSRSGWRSRWVARTAPCTACWDHPGTRLGCPNVTLGREKWAVMRCNMTWREVRWDEVRWYRKVTLVDWVHFILCLFLSFLWPRCCSQGKISNPKSNKKKLQIRFLLRNNSNC